LIKIGHQIADVTVLTNLWPFRIRIGVLKFKMLSPLWDTASHDVINLSSN